MHPRTGVPIEHHPADTSLAVVAQAPQDHQAAHAVADQMDHGLLQFTNARGKPPRMLVQVLRTGGVSEGVRLIPAAR